jgi:steroid 5-alpha reductase family enzyme
MPKLSSPLDRLFMTAEPFPMERMLMLIIAKAIIVVVVVDSVAVELQEVIVVAVAVVAAIGEAATDRQGNKA